MMQRNKITTYKRPRRKVVRSDILLRKALTKNTFNEENIDLFLDELISDIEKNSNFFTFYDSNHFVIDQDIRDKINFVKKNIIPRCEFSIKIEKNGEMSIYLIFELNILEKIQIIQMRLFDEYYKEYIEKFNKFESQGGDISKFPYPNTKIVTIFLFNIKNILDFLDNYYYSIEKYQPTALKIEEINNKISKAKIDAKANEKAQQALIPAELISQSQKQKEIEFLKDYLNELLKEINIRISKNREEYLKYEESLSKFFFIEEDTKKYFNELKNFFSKNNASMVRIKIDTVNDENKENSETQQKKFTVYSGLFDNEDLLKEILNLQVKLIKKYVEVVKQRIKEIAEKENQESYKINIEEILFLPRGAMSGSQRYNKVEQTVSL